MADETKVEEKKELSKQEHINKIADFSGGNIFNSSDTYSVVRLAAQDIATGTVIPDTFKKSPANCLVAISQAQKFGVDWFTMMNNMYMIQGRIMYKSEFVIAQINRSGLFDTELQYEEEEKDGKPYSCTCFAFKDGRKVTGIKVTMDMADKEGWTKKNGTKWTNMSQLMLRYRAATYFARFNAPEVLGGSYTVEEGEDVTFNSRKVKKTASLNDVIEEENIIDGEVISEG